MRFLLVAILLFAGVPQVEAQIINIGGSDSTLLSAQGGSIKTYFGGTATTLSGGLIYGQPAFGLTEEMRIHQVDFKAGDQYVMLPLLTDFAMGSLGYSARGIRASHERLDERDRWSIFVGKTTLASISPMFYTANAKGGTWVGVVTYHRELKKNLTFEFLAIGSSKQTVLSSFLWKPVDGMIVSASGGIGNNSPNFSGLFDFHRARGGLRVSYVTGGSSFRRLLVPNQLTSSNNGLNAQGTFKPTSWLGASAGHSQYTATDLTGTLQSRSTVDSVGLFESWKSFSLNQALFHSSSAGTSTSGASTGASANFWQNRITVSGSWYKSANYASTIFCSAGFRVTRRLSLSQYVTRTKGIQYFWGGSYAGNSYSVSVGYSEMFFPVVQGKNPFTNVLTATLNFRVRDTSIGISTVETPNQTMRYTVYGDTYLYGKMDAGKNHSSLGGKYVVQGIVQDEAGIAINGIAVLVTDERGKGGIVWSDSAGHFEARVKSATKVYTVALSPNDNLGLEVFAVRECPANAKADEVIHIVVERQ